MSEWLRRWTRNPLGSAREGSNPFGVVFVMGFSIVSANIRSDVQIWPFRRRPVDASPQHFKMILTGPADAPAALQNERRTDVCRLFGGESLSPHGVHLFSGISACGREECCIFYAREGFDDAVVWRGDRGRGLRSANFYRGLQSARYGGGYAGFENREFLVFFGQSFNRMGHSDVRDER